MNSLPSVSSGSSSNSRIAYSAPVSAKSTAVTQSPRGGLDDYIKELGKKYPEGGVEKLLHQLLVAGTLQKKETSSANHCPDELANKLANIAIAYDQVKGGDSNLRAVPEKVALLYGKSSGNVEPILTRLRDDMAANFSKDPSDGSFSITDSIANQIRDLTNEIKDIEVEDSEFDVAVMQQYFNDFMPIFQKTMIILIVATVYTHSTMALLPLIFEATENAFPDTKNKVQEEISGEEKPEISILSKGIATLYKELEEFLETLKERDAAWRSARSAQKSDAILEPVQKARNAVAAAQTQKAKASTRLNTTPQSQPSIPQAEENVDQGELSTSSETFATPLSSPILPAESEALPIKKEISLAEAVMHHTPHDSEFAEESLLVIHPAPQKASDSDRIDEGEAVSSIRAAKGAASQQDTQSEERSIPIAEDQQQPAMELNEQEKTEALNQTILSPSQNTSEPNSPIPASSIENEKAKEASSQQDTDSEGPSIPVVEDQQQRVVEHVVQFEQAAIQQPVKNEPHTIKEQEDKQEQITIGAAQEDFDEYEDAPHTPPNQSVDMRTVAFSLGEKAENNAKKVLMQNLPATPIPSIQAVKKEEATPALAVQSTFIEPNSPIPGFPINNEYSENSRGKLLLDTFSENGLKNTLKTLSRLQGPEGKKIHIIQGLKTSEAIPSSQEKDSNIKNSTLSASGDASDEADKSITIYFEEGETEEAEDSIWLSEIENTDNEFKVGSLAAEIQRETRSRASSVADKSFDGSNFFKAGQDLSLNRDFLHSKYGPHDSGFGIEVVPEPQKLQAPSSFTKTSRNRTLSDSSFRDTDSDTEIENNSRDYATSESDSHSKSNKPFNRYTPLNPTLIEEGQQTYSINVTNQRSNIIPPSLRGRAPSPATTPSRPDLGSHRWSKSSFSNGSEGTAFAEDPLNESELNTIELEDPLLRASKEILDKLDKYKRTGEMSSSNEEGAFSEIENIGFEENNTNYIERKTVERMFNAIMEEKNLRLEKIEEGMENISDSIRKIQSSLTAMKIFQSKNKNLDAENNVDIESNYSILLNNIENIKTIALKNSKDINVLKKEKATEKNIAEKLDESEKINLELTKKDKERELKRKEAEVYKKEAERKIEEFEEKYKSSEEYIKSMSTTHENDVRTIMELKKENSKLNEIILDQTGEGYRLQAEKFEADERAILQNEEKINAFVKDVGNFDVHVMEKCLRYFSEKNKINGNMSKFGIEIDEILETIIEIPKEEKCFGAFYKEYLKFKEEFKEEGIQNILDIEFMFASIKDYFFDEIYKTTVDAADQPVLIQMDDGTDITFAELSNGWENSIRQF